MFTHADMDMDMDFR